MGLVAAAPEEKALSRLSVSYCQMQDMLGDALGELKYLRACQQLGDRSLKVLQRKASLAVLRAKKNMQKEQNAGQAEHELQTQILLQDYQVSKAQLDVFQWKRRAAILQLRLDSQSEDTNHFQAAYKCLMEELKRQYKDSHWHEAQIKSLQEEVQLHKTTIESRELALTEAGIKITHAESQAGSAETAIQQQLQAAQNREAVLVSQLQEATASRDALSMQAAAAARDLKQAAAAAEDRLQKEFELKKALAGAGKELSVAKSREQEGVQAAEDKLRAVQKDLQHQIDELKELVKMQRNERNASEQSWENRLRHAEDEAKQERKQREVLQAQLEARKRMYVEDRGRQSESPSEAAEHALKLVSKLVGNDLPSQAVSSGWRIRAGPQNARDLPAEKVKGVSEAAQLVKPIHASPQVEVADPWALQPSPTRRGNSFPDTQSASPRPQASCALASGEENAAELNTEAPVATADSHEVKRDPQEQVKAATATVIPPEGNKRSRRQCKQKQPYWMGTTESPSSSIDDQNETEDPSFTAELKGAEIARKKRAPAGMDSDDCQATKRANKAASAEPIDQLSQTAEPINVIGQALDAVQQHRGNPDSATEEGSQEDSSTQQAVLEEAPEPAAAKRPIQALSKARGKKSRLGPQNRGKKPEVLDTGPALGKEENIEEVLVAPLDGNTDASEAIQLPDSGRPNGLSKIDLRDVWGGRTPAVSPEPTAADPSQKVSGRREEGKPDIETAKPGTLLEKNPLMAVTSKVIEAAAERRKAERKPAVGHLGARKSQNRPPGQRGTKRSLRPTAVLNDIHTRDLLLGQGFGLPKLKLAKLKKPGDML